MNPGFQSEIGTFLSAEAGLGLRARLPSIAPVIATTIASLGIDSAAEQFPQAFKPILD